jgi:hypothetical protein
VKKKEKDPIEMMENLSLPKKQRKLISSLDHENKLIPRDVDTISRLEAEKKQKRLRKEFRS